MTLRQKILKIVYPLFTFIQRIKGRNNIIVNKENINPAISIYSLSMKLNNGIDLSLRSLKGKKILFVNTASDCGYTHQYAALQKLYEQFNDHLEIIAFPSNDFKEQEKGTDEEIAGFCKNNYEIGFVLGKKTSVKKGNQQNKIYHWLTSKEENGWNEIIPSWNFSKYLVDE